MYECRGATLQEAVQQARRYPARSTKNLAKVAAKLDFTARMRMGSVLFIGEGNLSFALTMSRKPRCASLTVFWSWQAKPVMTGPMPFRPEKQILSKVKGCNGPGAFR
jgi:hypothetical protein